MHAINVATSLAGMGKVTQNVMPHLTSNVPSNATHWSELRDGVCLHAIISGFKWSRKSLFGAIISCFSFEKADGIRSIKFIEFSALALNKIVQN